MAAASFQQYKEMGESMGLSGADLADYVTKQQSADRAERQAEREARDKEKEREEGRAEGLKLRKKNVNIENCVPLMKQLRRTKKDNFS